MITHLFVSLPFVVCAVWFFVLLLDYIAQPTAVRLRLLVFMSAATLLYAGHMVYFSHEMDNFIGIDVIYGVCNLAVYPLYLIYIMQLTEGHIRRPMWLSLLPALAAAIVFSACHFVMNNDERNVFIQTYLYNNTTDGLSGYPLFLAYAHNVAKVIFFLLVLITVWKGTILLRHFTQRVKSYYSNTEGRTLEPITILLRLFIFTSVLSIVVNAIGREWFNDNALFLAIPSILFSCLLFGIGYIGSHQLFSHIDFEEDRATDAKDVPETGEELEMLSRMEELARRIEWLMKEERFYLQPNLRVSDLARRLGTNSKYISQATNQVLGQPFADYVNRYRVRHAQRLRQQRPDLTVNELANQSGYLSMQSFYRNMKRWGNK